MSKINIEYFGLERTKLKKCAGCGKDKVIWKNHEGEKFCQQCWHEKKPVKFPKQSKAIKPVSDKKKVQDQLYSVMRKKFLMLPENSTCRGKIPAVCSGGFQQDLTVHHTKGRGKYYLDTTTWIPLCMTCHEFVERNPEKAKDLGLSFSRLEKE